MPEEPWFNMTDYKNMMLDGIDHARTVGVDFCTSNKDNFETMLLLLHAFKFSGEEEIDSLIKTVRDHPGNAEYFVWEVLEYISGPDYENIFNVPHEFLEKAMKIFNRLLKDGP